MYLSFNQECSQKMIPSPIIPQILKHLPETTGGLNPKILVPRSVHRFSGSVGSGGGAFARDGQSQHHETCETAPGCSQPRTFDGSKYVIVNWIGICGYMGSEESFNFSFGVKKLWLNEHTG